MSQQKLLEKRKRSYNLKKGRKLFIPDYQREIRWTKEILFSLMNDIAHNSKFLGNIILSHKDEKNFEIIDGQQRIVSLLMLVDYIRENYEKEITDKLQFIITSSLMANELFLRISRETL